MGSPSGVMHAIIPRVIKVELLLGVVVFAVWVFALVDVLQTPAGAIRGGMPKIAWVIIVAVFQVIGALAWFVMGRPGSPTARTATAHERATPAFPEYDRPGRSAAADPAKDEEFLAQVRARAEEQRKRYEAERKRQRSEGDA